MAFGTGGEGGRDSGAPGRMAAEAAGAEVGWDGLEVASLPMAVHGLRRGDGASGWDPALPLEGWAYPAFTGGELSCLSVVGPGGCEAMPAGPGTALGAALSAACGMAALHDPPALLRLVRVPGGADLIWVDWGEDSFVDTRDARIVAGPDVAGVARESADGAYWDLDDAEDPITKD